MPQSDGHKIVLRRRKSRFVDILRKTPTRTVCPNFFVLAHANGCGFSPRCSYCYLKSSLWHLQGQHVFSNTRRLFQEVRRWIATDTHEAFVLNTGNLSDSLTFEAFRPLMVDLIEIFRRESEARGKKHNLLLVTKGGLRECRSLMTLLPCSRVIVSFSVNNHAAARCYEAGAPSVAERLRAARKLQDRGWRIRLRIDPMLLGYNYRRLARQVAKIAPERVTLGTLRAEPNLLRRVDPKLLAELEPSEDKHGLARYPRPVRLKLYGEAIHGLGSRRHVALCEETMDIWQALGLAANAKVCNCAL